MSAEQTPGPPWTILKLLNWTTDFLTQRGSETARLDAEYLLSHLLSLSRLQLYTHFDRPLVGDELADYRALVKRRASGEPIAYILGSREFWTLDLAVDPRVLIPRPDTETLVRAALKRLDTDCAGKCVDIGTGSGALALALAAERPQLHLAATDISAEALEVATANASRNHLDGRVHFCLSDLFDHLDPQWTDLEMVISNPPYIGERERTDLSREVLDFEPGLALFSGDDGLDLIRRLIQEAPQRLKPGGHLLLEIGYTQGPAVAALMKDAGFLQVDILQDYGDRDRVVAASTPT